MLKRGLPSLAARDLGETVTLITGVGKGRHVKFSNISNHDNIFFHVLYPHIINRIVVYHMEILLFIL